MCQVRWKMKREGLAVCQELHSYRLLELGVALSVRNRNKYLHLFLIISVSECFHLCQHKLVSLF